MVLVVMTSNISLEYGIVATGHRSMVVDLVVMFCYMVYIAEATVPQVGQLRIAHAARSTCKIVVYIYSVEE
jgi:hypothetical protein